MGSLPNPQQLLELAKKNAEASAKLVEQHPPVPASSGTVIPGETNPAPTITTPGRTS